MKDAVYRQDVIDVLEKILPADPMHSEYTQGITCGAALGIEYVKQLPPAQPEIIRCKDCRYWESGITRYGKCKLTNISVSGIYYCAVASRKDEQ